jgi:hypothetical protein
MAYETRVASSKELFDKLEDLDPDEGVRIVARYDGKSSFVFVTRHSGKYALWIRAAKQEAGSQPRREEFKDFKDFALLKKFLFGVISEPIKAYVY